MLVRRHGILVLVGLALLPKPAWSNGSEVRPDGGTIIPVESPNIQLVTEHVVITLNIIAHGTGTGWAECEYQLRNLTSSPQRVVVGFLTPAIEANEISVTQNSIRHWGPRHLAVTMAPLDQERWRSFTDTPPDSIPTWVVEFESEETVNLDIYYPVEWLGDNFAYHARPAALWAGTIYSATIEFHLGGVTARLLQCLDPGACAQVSVLPAGYEWSPIGLTWRFEDWEPREDPQFRITWEPDED